MDAISVEVDTREDALAELRDEWTALFTGSKCAPFLAWEWMSAWNRAFGSGGRPFILKALRDGRLIGLLPLRSFRRDLLGTHLAFIGAGAGGADYLDIIVRPGDRMEVAAAMIQYLSDDSRKFDLLRLDNVSTDSSIAAQLRTSRIPRYSELPAYVCPQIDLSGGWKDVLGQSRRSSNFRRRLKQLEKLSGFEFRSVTSPDALCAAFERFLSLHKRRWNSRGSELSGRPELVAFHRNVVSRMVATGLLRFDELWADGECRASIYGFDDGRTFYYYNTGFDPDWADRSVGMVLTGLSIRNSIDRGIAVYDFLRGDEAYKFDWANKTEQLLNLALSRDTLAARLAVGLSAATFRLRAVAKEVIPSGVAAIAKKVRWALARKVFDL